MFHEHSKVDDRTRKPLASRAMCPTYMVLPSSMVMFGYVKVIEIKTEKKNLTKIRPNVIIGAQRQILENLD